MRTYFGVTIENDHSIREIFATVTGQMEDGSLVYTEIEQDNRGAIVNDKNGNPKLMLDNQYTRHLKRGWQTFTRI